MVRLRLHRREPLRAELEAFVAVARGDEAPIVRGEDSLAVVELARALVRSGREGRVIERFEN